MLRMGRNPKEDAKNADTTADYTPQPQTQSDSTTGATSNSSSNASTNRSGASPANNQSSGQTPATSRAVTESESLARDIKEGTLSGFVGNGTMLTGEASFKGMLRVDGHLSGRISSQDGTLIVSTNGQVDANIEVSVAQIFGTVNGDIIATKRIEMGRVARITGNIQTPALVIENGAMFEGSCRMVHLKDVPAKLPSKNENATAATASTPATTSTSTQAASAPTAKAVNNTKEAGGARSVTNGAGENS